MSWNVRGRVKSLKHMENIFDLTVILHITAIYLELCMITTQIFMKNQNFMFLTVHLLKQSSGLIKFWLFLIQSSMLSEIVSSMEKKPWKSIRFVRFAPIHCQVTILVKCGSQCSTRNLCVTCRVDCLTLRVDMDKPYRGPTNRETFQRFLPLIWPLTVFQIFKNSNFEKSWIWWPRQRVP